MPSCSLQYGLTAEAPEALDEEQATALMEAYGTDKGWVAKGPASTTRPPPLRAGRIVCELYDGEVGAQCACVSSLLCIRPKPLSAGVGLPLATKPQAFRPPAGHQA